MKSIFIITFINIFASSLLNAEVAESYKCKLKEGVSRDQIISLGFKLSILFPMYSSDISNGVFYWNGTSSSLASLEDAVKIWESEKNIDAINRWVAIVDNCENASLFYSFKVN